MDGPEVIQATPRGHVLHKIQIERILLGNFDRLLQGCPLLCTLARLDV